MPSLTIRAASGDDLGAIGAIHAHYARETAVVFDEEPYDAAERSAWFGRFAPTGPHRLLVAVAGGEVVGYAHSLPWRPKAAYRPSVETTVLLRPGAEGRGIGTRLYGRLLAELATAGVHRAYAVVVLPNPASVALHLACGFRRLGVLTEVGWKLGRWWDTALFERAFPPDGG